MTAQCQRSSPRTKVNPLQPRLIKPVHLSSLDLKYSDYIHQKLQVDVRRRQLLADITSDHLIVSERRSLLWSQCIDERETTISSSTTKSRPFPSPTGEKQRGLFASYLTGLSIVFLVGQTIDDHHCFVRRTSSSSRSVTTEDQRAFLGRTCNCPISQFIDAQNLCRTSAHSVHHCRRISSASDIEIRTERRSQSSDAREVKRIGETWRSKR